MRKKTVFIIAAILLLFININSMAVCAKEEFTSVNPVIDVGEKIYVQHDADNNDIYDLQKSGTGTTTVYELVLAEFTANKAWTTSGEFIDNVAEKPHGATAPDKYISVTANEQYFIKTYGVGYNTGGTWYAPVLFLDDNDTVIADVLTNTLSASKAGVMITVPENATKMHLTMYNNQSFSLQKVLNLTDEEFDNLPINRTKLENDVNQMYEQYQKDRTVYKKPNKAYVTFVNDDTRASMSEYADLFIDKGVPLVLATVPEMLIEDAYNQTETRLEVARRVEAAGGEIIAHNGGVLTQEGFSDYNTMYSFFVRTKQLFNYYDFDVNGIILAGGLGQVTGAQESEEWASSIYSYSDLYGVEYDRKEIALDSAYYHKRIGLGNFASDLYAIKQEIDNAITNKSWLVFYFHDSSEIDTTILGKVLDYVNSKNGTDLEVVTYKEMYQKYAVKESEVTNTKHTYYVSSTGTSTVGTDENNPMSYETAKSKAYVSGDTILFKRGDTFYGTFDPTIVKVDEEITTISSYGEGELPNISGYKIVSTEEAWQVHEEGIYKVDLTDTQFFSGLMTISANSTNIGFLEDREGVKYFNKKSTLTELENECDFYCDRDCLYIKSSENPYSKLGELKLATKTNLLITQSNLKIENIEFSGTGAHGLVNSDETIKNVEISNNIIQDIGGSYLNGTTRYGNGIEFYGANVSNVVVKDNIIRNVYDVGFTIQGTKGSGKNIIVKNNVFVSNSQDSEVWENGAATGIESYEFTNNISVNAGRGWGYDARLEKYVTAHILFWGYSIENTDIYFHDNTVYNPRRIYFIEQTYGTDVFFKENDYIKSDYNTYFLAEDSTIFRDSYKIAEKDKFVSEYQKDEHSVFSLIEVEEHKVNGAVTFNDIKEIRKLFGVEEEPTVIPSPTTMEPSPTVTTEPSPTVTMEVSPTVTVELSPTVTTEPSPTVTTKPSPTATMVPTLAVTTKPSPTATMAPSSKVTMTPIPTATMIPIPTVTMTPIPTATIAPSPTAKPKMTLGPTITSTPKITVEPTAIPSPTVSIPKKGTKLIDTKKNVIYTVTKSGKSGGTVTYTKPVNKNVTSVSVSKKVSIDGISYKVTGIAPNAFKNCKKLKKVTIGNNVTIIGNSAFSGCSKLKTVTIGTKVTTIGAKAFYKCSALTKITIPSKVNKIEKQAFYKCKNLKNISIKTTKLTSKKVGSKAFQGINSKATIKVPKQKLSAYKKLLKAKGIGVDVEVKK
ncbi:MAG: leucine-rich repeat protein [Lachnospiraceae bacterium]|nr:leucine-rich repeat protein [Lachnospiraceae bacterium]